jgi:hypothetical protein
VSVTTWGELQGSFARWVKRDDLTALFPEFVQLAESRIYRALRVRRMEEAYGPQNLVNGSTPLPAGWLGFRLLRNTAEPRALITARPLEAVESMQNPQPRHYAVQGTRILYDAPDGEVIGFFYQRGPALTSVQPMNWLLSAAPDLYLFATLAEAHLYAMDDNQAAFWGARTDAVIGQMNAQDMSDRFSGPLSIGV